MTHFALESLWGVRLLPGYLGVSEEPAHQSQPSELPEASASSSGAEVVAGGREAAGTGTLSTKWYLWCNPHRLT